MNPTIYQQFADGIVALDTHMMRPIMVSSHLILEGGKAAFVDVGPSTSAPHLLAALSDLGLQREDVWYVLATHVHLDHAGGVGVMMRELPNATLVVHPRGARHMIDPSKLIAGATAVYGEEEIKRTYGEILPVPEERVVIAEDNFTLDFNGRPIHFWDTPGHAKHHNCIVDEKTRSVFTGDAFGLSYREFDSEDQVFILPTTSPVQFDPEDMHATIDRVANYQPSAVMLTHFSRLSWSDQLASDLHELVDAHVAAAESARHLQGDKRVPVIKEALWRALWTKIQQRQAPVTAERAQELLALDWELNAQGLICWLDRTSAT
jgi:glyoxylase-like metal-dependent hydrolase (beta-lactamase superfamily II)